MDYPKCIKEYGFWVRDERGFKTIISEIQYLMENNMPCLSNKVEDSENSTKSKII